MIQADLNLLRVFDVLYAERSVTRAAARLALTQSAVSHALKRLRETIGDRLFVRVGYGLEPTARADAIAAQIQAGLATLESALSPPDFDPLNSEREFRIMAGGYFCQTIVPRLLAELRRQAPRVSLRIVAPMADIVAQFDSGIIDLAMIGDDTMPRRLRMTQLYREEVIWIARADALPREEEAMHRFLAEAPRIAIARPRRPATYEDSFAFEAVAAVLDNPANASPLNVSHGSDVVAVVYDSATALALVENSDAVALVPRRLAELRVASGQLAAIETAEHGLSFPVCMAWHARSDEDEGLKWLRALIEDLLRED